MVAVYPFLRCTFFLRSSSKIPIPLSRLNKSLQRKCEIRIDSYKNGVNEILCIDRGENNSANIARHGSRTVLKRLPGQTPWPVSNLALRLSVSFERKSAWFYVIPLGVAGAQKMGILLAHHEGEVALYLCMEGGERGSWLVSVNALYCSVWRWPFDVDAQQRTYFGRYVWISGFALGCVLRISISAAQIGTPNETRKLATKERFLVVVVSLQDLFRIICIGKRMFRGMRMKGAPEQLSCLSVADEIVATFVDMINRAVNKMHGFVIDIGLCVPQGILWLADSRNSGATSVHVADFSDGWLML